MVKSSLITYRRCDKTDRCTLLDHFLGPGRFGADEDRQRLPPRDDRLADREKVAQAVILRIGRLDACPKHVLPHGDGDDVIGQINHHRALGGDAADDEGGARADGPGLLVVPRAVMRDVLYVDVEQLRGTAGLAVTASYPRRHSSSAPPRGGGITSPRPRVAPSGRRRAPRSRPS